MMTNLNLHAHNSLGLRNPLLHRIAKSRRSKTKSGAVSLTPLDEIAKRRRSKTKSEAVSLALLDARREIVAIAISVATASSMKSIAFRTMTSPRAQSPKSPRPNMRRRHRTRRRKHSTKTISRYLLAITSAMPFTASELSCASKRHRAGTKSPFNLVPTIYGRLSRGFCSSYNCAIAHSRVQNRSGDAAKEEGGHRIAGR